MGGHSSSDDPNCYRCSADIEPWAQADPLERLLPVLVAKGIWDKDRDAALYASIDQKFKECVAQAEVTGAPSLETMFDDVFERLPWHLVEQRAELLAGPRPPTAR
jgi:pyruvate dehydrogenase E1 component alpha subunit